jgi:hypothetical protein
MKNIVLALLLSTAAVSTLSAQDETAYFIQVASYASPKYKDFSKIHNLGYLFESPAPNGIPRVILGTFSSQGAAVQALNKVRTQGYKDAFLVKEEIEQADAVYVLQLATFKFEQQIDWGQWRRLAGNSLYAQMSDQKVRLLMGTYANEKEAEKGLQRIKNQAPKDAVVRRVSQKVIHKVTPFEMARTTAMPAAQATPRASVRSLQTLLLREGSYKSTADGVWGKVTETAAIQYQKENSRYQAYQMQGEKLPLPAVEQFSLQYYINLIATNPALAEQGLLQFQHPLAKAYLAYMYLNGDVQKPNYQLTVNELMNTAADQIFNNYNLPTRSNFKMDYAYRDIGQLILHLREMHEAVRDEPEVPCWLFRRHPDATETAFAPFWKSQRDDYTISADCGSFYAMPSFRTLICIARDFADRPDEAMAKTNNTVLNQSFAMPTPLDKAASQNLEAWQAELFANLAPWQKGTALQRGTLEALEFTFFYTLVGVEDYYIEQGFTAADARTMSLEVLYTAIAHYFKA